jgi:hypothetical protein
VVVVLTTETLAVAVLPLLAAAPKRTGWLVGVAGAGLAVALAVLVGPAVGLSGDLLLVVGVPAAVVVGFLVGGLLFRLLR